MNNNKNKNKSRKGYIALLLCFILIITGIFAFLTAHDARINRFQMGDMNVKVLEPDWYDEDGNVLDDSDDNGIPDFAEKLAPGQTVTKAPSALNTGSLEQWTFLMVGIPTASIDQNDNIGIGSSLEQRTKQITVRAFATQTEYLEDEEETPAKVWKAFTEDNDIYGKRAWDTDYVYNEDYQAVDIVLTRSSWEGSSTYWTYNYACKNQEAFLNMYNVLMSDPAFSVDRMYYYDKDDSTNVTSINDANVIVLKNSSRSTTTYHLKWYNDDLVEYSGYTFAEVLEYNSGDRYTTLYDKNGEEITIEQDVYVDEYIFPQNRVELFSLNNIDTENFVFIPYDDEIDYFPGADGYNYYVYGYKTPLDSGAETEQLFTSVTLDNRISMFDSYEHSIIKVIINTDETVYEDVDVASLITEDTIKNILSDNGYDANHVSSITYDGTPESEEVFVLSTLRNYTYTFNVEISE